MGSWIADKRQRALLARFVAVLDGLNARIARLEELGHRVFIDDGFAELTTDVASLAAGTANPDKRQFYISLLENAALTADLGEREHAKAMGNLLDELEFSAITLLMRMMQTEATQSFHAVWGSYPLVPVDLTTFKPEHGPQLLSLQAAGLVDLAEFRNSRDRAKGAGHLTITTRGPSFHRWVSAGTQKPAQPKSRDQ